ncbi:unnamed protein product [Sphenostylis stenocarpa]|uniref:RRM domain-containing protein n=1 Tax=Sphenostylis stenocarpa TaxID=92480 RepID=A0AA86VG28_9FABA|nr:unnamed protein product [Sphenostylis stenocarpa]
MIFFSFCPVATWPHHLKRSLLHPISLTSHFSTFSLWFRNFPQSQPRVFYRKHPPSFLPCQVASKGFRSFDSAGRKMRPVFCGNLDFDARQSDVERLFRRYGKVDRVDMKSGFAFVYMEDERDAEYAIRRLDRTEFGRKGRRIRVEWTKQERDSRRSGGDSRKSSSNSRPSKTLFVINFDPVHARTRDLERHFDPYGKILNIRIRRNFAFIQYESQEDATRALEATNLSKFMDRVITVEYAIRDDDDRDKRNGYSPERRGHDSPDGRYGRGRSPSPYRRGRGSPDYGHGSNPASRPETKGSPKYERAESPINGRYDSRSPPPRDRSRS